MTTKLCTKCRSEEFSDYYERNKDKVLEYKWDRYQRKGEEEEPM